MKGGQPDVSIRSGVIQRLDGIIGQMVLAKLTLEDFARDFSWQAVHQVNALSSLDDADRPSRYPADRLAQMQAGFGVTSTMRAAARGHP